jgi:Photosystem I reaction centre subunit XI
VVLQATGPFIKLGPLRNVDGVAEIAGTASAAGLVLILTACLTIYGAAKFQQPKSEIGVKTLSGACFASLPWHSLTDHLSRSCLRRSFAFRLQNPLSVAQQSSSAPRYLPSIAAGQHPSAPRKSDPGHTSFRPTIAGRPVDRDPLQSSEGWQKFTGGWLVGGLSGVAWGYILTQILPYCEHAAHCTHSPCLCSTPLIQLAGRARASTFFCRYIP